MVELRAPAKRGNTSRRHHATLLFRDGAGAVEIRRVEAAANYGIPHTDSAKPILRKALSAFEAELDRRRLFRVNRSAIVNLGRVREIERAPRRDNTP